MPGPVTSAASAGTHRLLREYDATCITSAADVRELLGLGIAPGDAQGAASGGRTDDTTRVRDALTTRTGRSAAEVARRAGMSVEGVSALLGLLELEGMVESTPTGWRMPHSAR